GPVTTATLPSRRIRSGMRRFPLAFPWLRWSGGRMVWAGGRGKGSRRDYSMWRAGREGGRKPPFPRRIRRVNRLVSRAADSTVSLYNDQNPIRPLKPHDMFRAIALTGLVAMLFATAVPLAPPARAQIGNIFSEPAPRPPGNIPRGGQQAPPADD